MTTEAELIYTIWDTISAGKANQDTNINERLMRSYLRSHRGKLLMKAYGSGMMMPDEVFQDLGIIPFKVINGELKSLNELPKIIRCTNNYGVVVNIGDYVISVLDSEEFETSKYNRFNKFHPKIKFINNRMYLDPGQEQVSTNGDYQGTSLNQAVKKIKSELYLNEIISLINLRAVLVNPDDEPNYDFTTSIYPLPDELVEDIINTVNARDFNIFLKTRSDEVGDKRNNSGMFEQPQEI